MFYSTKFIFDHSTISKLADNIFSMVYARLNTLTK